VIAQVFLVPHHTKKGAFKRVLSKGAFKGCFQFQRVFSKRRG
jgi:hypothetical protein